jgi:hypothetical protein
MSLGKHKKQSKHDTFLMELICILRYGKQPLTQKLHKLS